MDAPNEQCPDWVDLEQHIENDSSDPQIADHVERCDQCRKAIDEISSNRSLFEQIRDDRTRKAVGDAVVVVDGYDIQHELERGGQGVVYRARQRATNRVVALKVLLAGTFATEQQRRRFEREIEIVAGLDHPNIVTVYESGVTRHGEPYLAMQFVEGAKLDDWMREHSMATLERRLRLFVAICDGVVAAHRHGVIHRDLKPQNIVVDEDGRPHILDFGIARLSALDTEELQTATGTFLGTLAYASPEHVRRNPALIDTRSDVYSLGVILYEMLTEALPFDTQGDLPEVLHAITSEAPRPLVAAGFAVADTRSVRGELEWIVMKSLAKERDRRYQSVREFRDDIERFLAGQAVHARRDRVYLVRKAIVRYRAPVTIAALFVIVLVASTIALFVSYQRARREAEKVREINMFLEDTLGSVEAAESGRDVTVRELLDEAAQWIDIALGEKPEVAASIETIVGNSYRNLGDYSQAERHLQSALRRRLELFGEKHAEVAHSLSVLALLRRDEGRLSEAEDLFREALAIRKKELGRDSISVAFTLANLALVRRDRGDHVEAEQLLRESLDIRRRHHGDIHQDVAMCNFNLATVAEAAGHLDDAILLHRRALDTRRRVLDRRHPDLSRSLFEIGRLLIKSDSHAEAVLALEECLQLRHDSFGGDHQLTRETQELLTIARRG